MVAGGAPQAKCEFVLMPTGMRITDLSCRASKWFAAGDVAVRRPHSWPRVTGDHEILMQRDGG